MGMSSSVLIGLITPHISVVNVTCLTLLSLNVYKYKRWYDRETENKSHLVSSYKYGRDVVRKCTCIFSSIIKICR